MKYFTPDLLERYGSPDDTVADAASAEWDQAVQRYHRSLTRILPKLPRNVRRFRAGRACLHDARLLSMTRQGKRFLIVLQLDSPPKTVVLTFTLAGEPTIHKNALPLASDSEPVTWLYEEWRLDRQQRPWFEVLLSNGWGVELPFRDFQYVIGEQLLLAENGRATPAPQPA